ncbi:hypothetical protein LJB42_004193 [Komagataella kurtzmanii]|nr:hypothetical protein LJB42_004193 [Komagataella kurtzmanii]
MSKHDDSGSERDALIREDEVVDAMGMVHDDSSQPQSHLADYVVDHTIHKHQRRKKSLARRYSMGPNRPSTARTQSASSSGSPSQTTRPSFAEKWVKRHSVASIPPPQFHHERQNYGSVAGIDANGSARIDLDLLNTRKESHNSIFEKSDEPFEFSDSNPSSRRSSTGSSLNDVCFPVEALDEQGQQKVWPDIQVLEDFAKEESLTDINANEEQSFKAPDNTDVGFQYPIVTSIDTGAVPSPQLLRRLGSSRVDETEPINGRLRPPKVNPWKQRKSSTSLQNFPHKDSRVLFEQYRFTYFREDLESTVHSLSISGLVQEENMSFDGLFNSATYMKKFRAANSKPPSVNNLNISKSATPIPNSDSGADADTDSRIIPFWLDVLNPTEEEMKVISKAFGIHPLTTEDIFLGETREKVELFKEYYFVCFRSFDIVQERYKRRKAAANSKISRPRSYNEVSEENTGVAGVINRLFHKNHGYVELADNRSIVSESTTSLSSTNTNISYRTKKIKERKNKQKGGYRHKPKEGELEPLNMYICVFKDAVISFHFAATPHPVNVRRRARLLRDYLTVTSDWISYALIDDITDAFAPMIESIEDEVNEIEDAILSLHSLINDSSSSDEDDSDLENLTSRSETKTLSSKLSGSSNSTSSNIVGWKRKGDMLRRIGECRKRVMSLLRLLGSKADVIKGFAKRCNEKWDVAPRSEIGMYLGDIQDHIVTMVQALNHYEKLLARSHSNYLAQINIDMTKVNNDMNDVLGKITILGTVVLPMNIVTGLWGMNCIVPGQDYDGLAWFWGITLGMFSFATCLYLYAKRATGI